MSLAPKYSSEFYQGRLENILAYTLEIQSANPVCARFGHRKTQYGLQKRVKFRQLLG